jgi:general secretion pathway protein K
VFSLLRSRQGSATLLSIFLASIIIVVGIGFNWLVKEHLKAAEGLKLKAEAMLKCYSGFDSLMYFLITGNRTSRAVVNPAEGLLGRTELVATGEEISITENLRIELRDANGMLSLATPNEAALKRLVEMVAGTDGTEVIESFLDWIDEDRLVRANGAEEAYYSGLGLPYTPRNGMMQYKEEFALLRGMSLPLYRKIEPFITLLPSQGFNPNTASTEALRAFMNIDDDTARSLKEKAGNTPVLSPIEVFTHTGRSMFFGGDEHYAVAPFLEVIVKSGSPKTVYRIHAGVDLNNPSRTMPYGITFWKEG